MFPGTYTIVLRKRCSVFTSNFISYKDNAGVEPPLTILLSGGKRRLGVKPSNDHQDQKVEEREGQGPYDISATCGRKVGTPAISWGSVCPLSWWNRLGWFLSLPTFYLLKQCSQVIFSLPLCAALLLTHSEVTIFSRLNG